jgi:transposase
MELKMTLKEADRFAIMKRLENKEINLQKAAEELGLSYKQISRIWKSYKQKGARGLISLRKGKPSNNCLKIKFKEKILKIIKEKYIDYGPTLAKEKLEEKHKLKLSKETLRQLMIKNGIWKSKKIKERKIYARRTRRSRFGDLEQIDGSYEYWFEDRGEKSCLLVSVDDATSALTCLKFCKTETTQDYLEFLKDYLKHYGRPMAFYSDKHSVFRVNNKQKQEGLSETRFQKILKQLDIELICANSPQAKGRVERANKVLQDRLIKELREKDINTIEQANEYLEEFRLKYNKKFAVTPAKAENAHRQLLSEHKLEELFMLQEERVLSKDLSFQYKTQIYQINSQYKNRLYGKKVQIYEYHGEIKMIMQNGKKLKYHKWIEKIAEPTKTLDVKELEIFWPTINRKPKRNHPWR